MHRKLLNQYFKTDGWVTPTIGQKSVDKLYDTMYNDGKDVSQTENDIKKNPEPDSTKRFNFASEIDGWAKKNQDSIKFAGDGAINSIKKAANDYINKYLKDAPEEADKDELLSSIVKWQLARDANDDERGKVAMNNIIGHMSTVNKEHYLKEEIPLSEYVNAKDDFDHKTGKYTTTEYATKEPDEDVKKVQQTLNENGAKNKYGDNIKVDGFVGSETLKAVEDLEKENKNDATMQKLLDMATHKYVWKETEDGKLKLYDEKTGYPVSFASAGGPVDLPELPELYAKNQIGFKTISNYVKMSYDKYQNLVNSFFENIKGDFRYLKERFAPTSQDGVLSEADNDDKRNFLKKTMIKCFSTIWKREETPQTREVAHEQAEKYRKFDDNSFNRAIYLNDSSGAGGVGHNAVMLINKDDYAIVFSFYPVDAKLPDALLDFAEVRFAVLSPDEMNNVLYGTGEIKEMIATDGGVKNEVYDRHVYFDINNGQGYNMYNYAVSIFDRPGIYSLFLRQCDIIAQDIFEAGGIDLKYHAIPNNSYEHEKWERV